MRRGFARAGATRRLIASRLLQLAKTNGRLKQLRPLSQSRLLSGPNNESIIPACGLICATRGRIRRDPSRAADNNRIRPIYFPTATVIAAVSQSSTGALSIRMHDKLAALIALGKHLEAAPCQRRTHHSNTKTSLSAMLLHRFRRRAQ
jgi:hypothetical protein